MNRYASALGKMAKGKAKTLTKAERKRRADAMRLIGKRNRKNVLQ